MKKVLSMLLALAMVLTMAAFPAFADGDYATLTAITNPDPEGSKTSDKAVDGDEATFYAINTYKGSVGSSSVKLKFELDETITMGSLELYWAGSGWGYQAPDSYKVYVSEDNVTYTEVLSQTGLYSLAVGEHDNINVVNASSAYRKIRVTEPSLTVKNVRYLYIEITAYQYRACLAEVKVGKKDVSALTPATYTVKYVNEQGEEIADAKTVEGKYVGDTVKEEAIKVDGYKCTEEPKTVTLVDGTNEIVFTYAVATNVTYTVNYVDAAGNPIADAKTVTAYDGDEITEAAATVAGYFLDETSFVKNVTLAVDADNDITFTYKKVLVPTKVSATYATGVSTSGGNSSDWASLYDGNVNRTVQYAPVGASYVAGTSPMIVTYAFAGLTDFTKLTTLSSGNRADSVKVYTSMNGTDWTEVGTYEPKTAETKVVYTKADGSTVTTYVNEYDLTGKSGTQVRFEVLASPAGAWCGIYEMMVEGSAATPVAISADNVVAPNWGWTTSGITDGTAGTLFDGAAATNAVGFFNHGYYGASSQPEVGKSNIEIDLGAVYDNPIITIQGGASDWNYTHIMAYEIYVAGIDGVYGEAPVSGFDNGTNADVNKVRTDMHQISAEGVRYVKIVPTYMLRRTVIGEISVYGTLSGTIEPDEPDTPDIPDTPDESEKDPITLTPAGVSAPTNTNGKPFALATDGDNTTFYAVSGYYGSLSTVNYQMVFDVGYLGKVDSLDILWGADSWGNTTPDAYKVEVSSDGKTWTQKKSYSGIYDITTGAAADNISGKDTVFGITTSKWAVDNNDANVNAYTLGNILEKNLGWENVRYIRVTVTSVQYRLAISEVTIGSLPNEDQIVLSKGGQIRVADTDKNISAGLRFGASIIKMNTGIEGEYKYSDNADTKFGMFMLPKDMLDGKTLTAYLANGVQQALDIPAKKIYEQDDNFIVFTAVLTGIPTGQYNAEIVAVPYMLKDGEYTYFEDMTKSYVGVAEAARNSTYSDTAIAAVTDETLKAEMQAVADELDKIIEAAKEEIVVRTLPFSRGINVNKMETFLSENTYGAFEEGIEELTKESTYTNIKSQGFDHVRIPVNFYTIYFEAPTGKYGYTTEQLMGYVDTAINLAIKNGLYVTLDFHGWFYIGSEENDYEEFIYCWTQVAERYKDYSDMLSFELLNEPWYTNGQAQQYLSDSRLSQMQVEAINIIRNTGSNNAERLIIICTADGNKAWKISALSAELKACKNIALAIHEYSPYNFTHQNFSWAGLSGQTTTLADAGGLGGANYDFSLIKKFMEETGIPVVLNEFGLNLDKASDEDIDTYIRYITTFCETNNIPWAYWQYSGGYSTEGSMSLYRKTSRYGSQAWDEFALDALFLR